MNLSVSTNPNLSLRALNPSAQMTQSAFVIKILPVNPDEVNWVQYLDVHVDALLQYPLVCRDEPATLHMNGTGQM